MGLHLGAAGDVCMVDIDTVKDGAGLWAEGSTIGFSSVKNGIARNLGRPTAKWERPQ
jgi:hypothetical protein